MAWLAPSYICPPASSQTYPKVSLSPSPGLINATQTGWYWCRGKPSPGDICSPIYPRVRLFRYLITSKWDVCKWKEKTFSETPVLDNHPKLNAQVLSVYSLGTYTKTNMYKGDREVREQAGNNLVVTRDLNISHVLNLKTCAWGTTF